MTRKRPAAFGAADAAGGAAEAAAEQGRAARRVTLGPAEHVRIAEAVRGGAGADDLVRQFGLGKKRARALRCLYGSQGAAPLAPARAPRAAAPARQAARRLRGKQAAAAAARGRSRSRVTLGAAEHARIAEAVQGGEQANDLARGFGLSKRRAQELRAKYGAEAAAPLAPARAPRRALRATAASHWLAEANRCFSVGAGPEPRPVEELSGGPADDAQATSACLRERRWMALGSWTFCPRCGRRNATGPWAAAGHVEAAAVACPGGCDLPPAALERAAPARVAPRSEWVLQGNVRGEPAQGRQHRLSESTDAPGRPIAQPCPGTTGSAIGESS